jgi:hypothetical protein
MKKKHLFSTLMLFSCICRAQFFALELDSVNPYVTALPYPMDSYYRVVTYDHRFPAFPVNRTKIKVYNSMQQYIKTINLLKGITLVNDYPPLLHDKRLLWPANYIDTISYSQNSLVILELDTNYNFIALHKLSTHSKRAIPTGLVSYSNGFLVGEYFNDSTISSGISTKIFKLSLSFQKKDSVLFMDELRLKTHNSKNDKIVGASEKLSPACTNTNQVTQKILLDTNLAIVDCFNTIASSVYFCYDSGGNVILVHPVKYKPKGIIFPLSNYRNYIHAESNNYNCSPLISNKAISSGVYKGNVPGNSSLNYNYPVDTEFPLYQASNCDYYGANTIYVGTIGLLNNYAVDKNFYRPYYAKPKTKISVTKLDTMGNIVWSKQYGGDMNYFARSVAFIEDGGCIVAGSRYDSAAFYPNGVFENFLLKLDMNGDVINVGVKETTSQKNEQMNCFPNPTNKTIYFDIPHEEDITIQICNNIGQVVLQSKNYVNLTSMDVQDLQAGMYVYKIITAKQVYSGKLLKE